MQGHVVTAPEPRAEVITVTIRTDDPTASEHIKHLLEAEGYDADITVREAS